MPEVLAKGPFLAGPVEGAALLASHDAAGLLIAGELGWCRATRVGTPESGSRAWQSRGEPGSGGPTSIRSAPCPSSAMRRPAASLDASSAAPSTGPARNAALASTSACHACPVTTVTPASPLAAGSPVAGSMRWWRGVPSGAVQARFVRHVEATAPASIAMAPTTRSASFGSAIATTHPSPSGATPSARRSPPTFTNAPRAPSASTSADDEIRGEALADSARVDLDSRTQPHRTGNRVEPDLLGARAGRRRVPVARPFRAMAPRPEHCSTAAARRTGRTPRHAAHEAASGRSGPP